MKCNMHKLQCVFAENADVSLHSAFDILKLTQRGRLSSMIVRGDEKEIEEKMKALSPVYFEILSLSLEEIFINETEVAGYDIKNLIF